MASIITPDDPRLSWYGAVSFERGDGWIKPWRIPFEKRQLFGKTAIDDMMLSRAGMPAGVRIAFTSNTEMIEGAIEPVVPNQFNVAETDAAKIDLVCSGSLHSTFELGDKTTFKFDGLPGGEKLIELWLPEYREICLRSLGLDEGATLAPYNDTRPRWLAYGSSYTQSRGATSPFYTWPAVAAREHNLNHSNLAYGGQCHLDSMVARFMRDLPAEIISMDVGINIYGSGTLNARSFRAALIGFVEILREGHADIPLAIMSAIYSYERENTANAAGLTLDTRELVSEAVETLRANGDRNIHYFNGLEFLGEGDKELIEDHIHPNAEGYKLLGKRFAAQALSRFLPLAVS